MSTGRCQERSDFDIQKSKIVSRARLQQIMTKITFNSNADGLAEKKIYKF
jgi:hypothetical protein